MSQLISVLKLIKGIAGIWSGNHMAGIISTHEHKDTNL